jgi:hypothetical protein
MSAIWHDINILLIVEIILHPDILLTVSSQYISILNPM